MNKQFNLTRYLLLILCCITTHIACADTLDDVTTLDNIEAAHSYNGRPRIEQALMPYITRTVGIAVLAPNRREVKACTGIILSYSSTTHRGTILTAGHCAEDALKALAANNEHFSEFTYFDRDKKLRNSANVAITGTDLFPGYTPTNGNVTYDFPYTDLGIIKFAVEPNEQLPDITRIEKKNYIATNDEYLTFIEKMFDAHDDIGFYEIGITSNTTPGRNTFTYNELSTQMLRGDRDILEEVFTHQYQHLRLDSLTELVFGNSAIYDRNLRSIMLTHWDVRSGDSGSALLACTNIALPGYDRCVLLGIHSANDIANPYIAYYPMTTSIHSRKPAWFM